MAKSLDFTIVQNLVCQVEENQKPQLQIVFLKTETNFAKSSPVNSYILQQIIVVVRLAVEQDLGRSLGL